MTEILLVVEVPDGTLARSCIDDAARERAPHR